LALAQSANTGRRLFQYNVKFVGSDIPEFAVYDEMMIGNPDVRMEFTTQLMNNGDIEVIQAFINNTENIYTYDCRLTTPNQGLQTRITRKGFGRAEYVYVIKNGKALHDAGREALLMAQPVRDGTNAPGEPMVYTIPLLDE
jgi:hypothetical protein